MTLLTCSLAAALLSCSNADSGDGPTLVGFASLPPDTFEPGGHRSGQFLGGDQVNGRRPPFDSQPIQGISDVVAGDEPDAFLALSDNGYGAKSNSADYILTVYRLKPDFKTEKGGTGKVEVEVAFRLSDPEKHIKWPIVADRDTYPNTETSIPAEIREGRLLTGADLDVESMVRLPDGTFWIGDEFGPFLLHFGKDGKLLEAPVELPGEGMHSPDHPTKDPAEAKIGRSAGFEATSLVFAPDLDIAGEPTGRPRQLLGIACYLEKRVGTGGPPMFAFQLLGRRASFDHDSRSYPLAGDAEAIGAATTIDLDSRDSRMFAHLIVERDGGEGSTAKFKRLCRFDFTLNEGEERETIKRTELADLLNLPDPHDLNSDGARTFRFPFVTIESVLPVDERTVLVINDNNYPRSSGRTPGQPDPTEFILIRFDRPLAELGHE